MLRTPQTLGMLEMELSKQLVVSYTLKENLSRRRSTDLLPDDDFVFVSHLRNNSNIVIKNIRGSIAPTQFTEFRIARFDVRELEPGQESQLAVVHARVTRGSRHGSVVDNIGSVTLTAAADLSILRFREWNKPLIRIRPAVQKVLAKPRFRIVQRRVRRIPLSPTTSAFELHHRGGNGHLFFPKSGTGWRRVPTRAHLRTLNPDSLKT